MDQIAIALDPTFIAHAEHAACLVGKPVHRLGGRLGLSHSLAHRLAGFKGYEATEGLCAFIDEYCCTAQKG